MLVVKLGGSMSRDPALRDWLELLTEQGGGRVVIVAGGGGFADQVRAHQACWGFNDLAAHNMAILAMMQHAFMLHSLVPGMTLASSALDISAALHRCEVAVWTPSGMLRERADDMTHWDVTSDSLAAWLSGHLVAERLVVVKSCLIEPGLDLAAHTRNGTLDDAFERFTRDAGYLIDIVNKSELDRMRALLQHL